MFPRALRLVFEAVLFFVALGLGAADARGSSNETVADQLYFGAWRLQLHLRPPIARIATPAIVDRKSVV